MESENFIYFVQLLLKRFLISNYLIFVFGNDMILKKRVIYGVALIISVMLVLTTVSGNKPEEDKIADVLIYAGVVAWGDGVLAFEKFLEFKGLTWYECDGTYIENNNLIGSFDAIHFPGGNSGYYIDNINSVGLQNIRNFVSAGGGNIRICTGGYFACDRVIWEGTTYEHPLDLFNGVGYGAIDEIAPWPGYAMTTININLTNPINQYEPSTEYTLYYGGAAYYPDERQEMNVIGTYELFNDDAAMINFEYGNGRVILIGPHPEIEEDSTRDGVSFGDNLEDIGTDWNLLWTCIDWLMSVPISEPPDPMPPNIPKISGPKRGRVGTEIKYKFSAVDPESEELYYWIEWGDGTSIEWFGPYASGNELTKSHNWSEEGDFNIRCKCKDPSGNESEWGTLEVTIPKNKQFNMNSFFLKFLENHPRMFPKLRQLLGVKTNILSFSYLIH